MLDLNVATRLGNFSIDVNIKADSGVTALFGPSGAGKTTLVNMLAGLLRPERGHIIFQDEILFDEKQGIYIPTEGRRIGYV